MFAITWKEASGDSVWVSCKTEEDLRDRIDHCLLLKRPFTVTFA